MKKKLIALSLGFTFLIAGFGVSYDFDFGTFEVNSNEVKAELLPKREYNGRLYMSSTMQPECKWKLFNCNCNTANWN